MKVAELCLLLAFTLVHVFGMPGNGNGGGNGNRNGGGSGGSGGGRNIGGDTGGNGLSNSTEGNSDDPRFKFLVEPLGNLRIYWKVNGDCSVAFRISLGDDAWFAFGFGRSMADGRVIIADGNDLNGNIEFILSGRSLVGIDPYDGPSGIVGGSSAWFFENRRRELFVNLTSISGQEFTSGCNTNENATEQSLLAARGSSLALSKHSSRASFKVDWISGPKGILSPTDSLINAHAWLMTFAFAVLMPIQVGFAISKNPEDKWFDFHRLSTGVSVLFFLSALICAFVFVEDHMSKGHHILGIIILVVVFANPVQGLLRPKKESEHRRKWRLGHKTSGYISLGLGMINMITGSVLLSNEQGYGGSGSIAVAIVFILLGIGVIAFAHWKKRQEEQDKQKVSHERP